MQVTITDAHGRDIRDLTECDRCHQLIKDAFKFEGKYYGSECIKKVTGEDSRDLVIIDGEVDMEATHQKQADWQAQQKFFAEQAKQMDFVACANAPMWEVLNGMPGSAFAQSLKQKIETTPIGDLSPKQVQALRDIFVRHCDAKGKLVVGQDDRTYWTITDDFKNFDELFNAMFIDRTLVFDRNGKKL